MGWDKGMEPILGQHDWRVGKFLFSGFLPVFITLGKMGHRELGRDGPFQGLPEWEMTDLF
jgi:hypothetical protein